MAQNQALITRKLEINAAHRLHDDTCPSIHGHRYEIHATCAESLDNGDQSSSSAMILDARALKNIMVGEIDSPCDHSFIFSIEDPHLTFYIQGTSLQTLADELGEVRLKIQDHNNNKPVPLQEVLQKGAMEKGSLLSQFQAQGFLSSDTKGAPFERLYLIMPSPTVEALARHWHDRLQAKIEQHSKGKTALQNVRVYETPNIYADYSL